MQHNTGSWWIFFLGESGMLTVAMFTSVFQTVRSALANPTKSTGANKKYWFSTGKAFSLIKKMK